MGPCPAPGAETQQAAGSVLPHRCEESPTPGNSGSLWGAIAGSLEP